LTVIYYFLVIGCGLSTSNKDYDDDDDDDDSVRRGHPESRVLKIVIRRLLAFV